MGVLRRGGRHGGRHLTYRHPKTPPTPQARPHDKLFTRASPTQAGPDHPIATNNPAATPSHAPPTGGPPGAPANPPASESNHIAFAAESAFAKSLNARTQYPSARDPAIATSFSGDAVKPSPAKSAAVNAPASNGASVVNDSAVFAAEFRSDRNDESSAFSRCPKNTAIANPASTPNTTVTTSNSINVNPSSGSPREAPKG